MHSRRCDILGIDILGPIAGQDNKRVRRASSLSSQNQSPTATPLQFFIQSRKAPATDKYSHRLGTRGSCRFHSLGKD